MTNCTSCADYDQDRKVVKASCRAIHFAKNGVSIMDPCEWKSLLPIPEVKGKDKLERWAYTFPFRNGTQRTLVWSRHQGKLLTPSTNSTRSKTGVSGKDIYYFLRGLYGLIIQDIQDGVHHCRLEMLRAPRGSDRAKETGWDIFKIYLEECVKAKVSPPSGTLLQKMQELEVQMREVWIGKIPLEVKMIAARLCPCFKTRLEGED